MTTVNTLRSTTVAAAVLALCGLHAPASGNVPPGADPQPTPLSGPHVTEAAGSGTGATLIHRDFDGRLKRLEVHPVAAALDAMDLSESERDAAQGVLINRSLAIERIIRENLKTVVDAQGAFKPGDDGRGQTAVVKLYQLAQPVFNKGKLVDLAAAALPEAKGAELRRMVAEYMDAAVKDRMAGNVEGKKADRFGAFIAENMALFGKEVETAAKRTFEGGEKDFKEMARRLGLSPEQESKIQALFVSAMTKDYKPVSKAEKMKLLLGAYSLLNDEQRSRLREVIAEEARDSRRKAEQRRAPKPAQDK